MTDTFHARRRLRGFTLIELMIVVAIVGILVAVALPAYNQSVRKSRRADAKTALLDLAQREERYNSTANQYSGTATDLGYPTGTTFPISVQTGSTSYYTISITPAPGDTATALPSTTFLATAAPVSGTSQATDTCGSFTLLNTGVQGVTGGTSSAADCW